MHVVWQRNINLLSQEGVLNTGAWNAVEMTGLLSTRMTLKPSEKNAMVLVSKTSALIPFVCGLIGCQGLWTTDLCCFRLMLRLEHDSGSVNVQPERGARPRLVCHHLQSHHAKQLCLPTAPWAQTCTQSIPLSSCTFYPGRHSLQRPHGDLQ